MARGRATGRATARTRRPVEPSEGPGVRTSDGINHGARIAEGPCVGTDDSPELAKGRVDDPDEVLADGELHRLRVPAPHASAATTNV